MRPEHDSRNDVVCCRWKSPPLLDRGIAIAALIILGAAKLFTTRTPHTTGRRAPASPISEKSIAVLPFQNLSDDKSNAYFTDGIQDEILTRLSKIAALKVISRTSTQKYKSTPENLREVGQQLGVANFLEGSVQKVANAVHVNVQLIRAARPSIFGRKATTAHSTMFLEWKVR